MNKMKKGEFFGKTLNWTNRLLLIQTNKKKEQDLKVHHVIKKDLTKIICKIKTLIRLH